MGGGFGNIEGRSKTGAEGGVGFVLVFVNVVVKGKESPAPKPISATGLTPPFSPPPPPDRLDPR
jgi:hypothetical protein